MNISDSHEAYKIIHNQEINQDYQSLNYPIFGTTFKNTVIIHSTLPRMFLYLASLWIDRGAMVDWGESDKEPMIKKLRTIHPSSLVYKLLKAKIESDMCIRMLAVTQQDVKDNNKLSNTNKLYLCWGKSVLDCDLFQQIRSTYYLKYREIIEKLFGIIGQVSLEIDINNKRKHWIVWQNGNTPINISDQILFHHKEGPDQSIKSTQRNKNVYFGFPGALYRSLLKQAISLKKPILWLGNEKDFYVRLNQVRHKKASLFGKWKDVIKKFNIQFFDRCIFTRLTDLMQFLSNSPTYEKTIVIPDLRQIIELEKKSKSLRLEPQEHLNELTNELRNSMEVKKKVLIEKASAYYFNLQEINKRQVKKLTEEELIRLKKEYIQSGTYEINSFAKKKMQEIQEKGRQFIEDRKLVQKLGSIDAAKIHSKYEDDVYNNLSVSILQRVISLCANYHSDFLIGMSFYLETLEKHNFSQITKKTDEFIYYCLDQSKNSITSVYCTSNKQNKYVVDQFIQKKVGWKRQIVLFDDIVIWNKY